MLSTNLGNSGKVMLYLFLTIGLVLGVTAFILVLTKKCEQCKTEGLNFNLVNDLGKTLENDVRETRDQICDKASVPFCKLCLNSPEAMTAVSNSAYNSCKSASNTYHSKLDECRGSTACEAIAAGYGLGQCVSIFNDHCK